MIGKYWETSHLTPSPCLVSSWQGSPSSSSFSFRLSLSQVGFSIVLGFLLVKSNEGVNAEKNSKVGDHRGNRQTEGEEIIPREVRAQGEKRKNAKSAKRSKKGKETRQQKNEGKIRANNGKKKHKGGGKSKRKEKKRAKKKNNSRQSCSSNEVSLTCMKNAMEGMMFEKNQISNYLKQAKRLENHGTISTNKVDKKNNFDDAKKHLFWAIGGNLSNPKCGPNTTAEKTA